MYSLFPKKKPAPRSVARRNPSPKGSSKLIYLSPRGRAPRANPYDTCAAVDSRRHEYEGTEFELLRGPRKGKFKVIGCGTGKTAKRPYGSRDYGTYAVQFEGQQKEKYLPNRYISQLYYRTTDKGAAAAAKARANYLGNKRQAKAQADDRAFERRYQTGKKRREARELAAAPVRGQLPARATPESAMRTKPMTSKKASKKSAKPRANPMASKPSRSWFPRMNPSAKAKKASSAKYAIVNEMTDLVTGFYATRVAAEAAKKRGGNKTWIAPLDRYKLVPAPGGTGVRMILSHER